MDNKGRRILSAIISIVIIAVYAFLRFQRFQAKQERQKAQQEQVKNSQVVQQALHKQRIALKTKTQQLNQKS